MIAGERRRLESYRRGDGCNDWELLHDRYLYWLVLVWEIVGARCTAESVFLPHLFLQTLTEGCVWNLPGHKLPKSHVGDGGVKISPASRSSGVLGYVSGFPFVSALHTRRR